MKIKLGALRRIIREAAADHWPGGPVRKGLTDEMGKEREQLGVNSAEPVDTQVDPDGLPGHLHEPDVSPEDCYGPVPPDAEDPYVGQDPFVRDAMPNPLGGGERIKRG